MAFCLFMKNIQRGNSLGKHQVWVKKITFGSRGSKVFPKQDKDQDLGSDD